MRLCAPFIANFAMGGIPQTPYLILVVILPGAPGLDCETWEFLTRLTGCPILVCCFERRDNVGCVSAERPTRSLGRRDRSPQPSFIFAEGDSSCCFQNCAKP